MKKTVDKNKESMVKSNTNHVIKDDNNDMENINNELEDLEMQKNVGKGDITKRDEDYSKWYLSVIAAADLAENSPVRGCMVIKPNGYAIWERIQSILDAMFKKTGVQNAYFPVFIPQSFLAKEAEHIEGFAKECAVVTHHRLRATENGVVPDGELDEPLIVRPTSETIMYHMYSKWVNSYSDLPLLINQWANVVRWEMKTKPFLRTTEFLWQEGHTAHATKKEAEDRTRQMLDIYQMFCEEYLAIPVIPGHKTESERFAGADDTLCIEAMMQDGKALQAGTSHMLGQNFAKPFNVKYLNNKGESKFVWQTSWGLSTRIIGALIMVHSDDDGLVLPPKIAPTQVVIIPVWRTDEEKKCVLEESQKLVAELQDLEIRVLVDERDGRPGAKFFEWERRGIPVRIEIGPKDISNDTLVLVRRDDKVKTTINREEFSVSVPELLKKIQTDMYQRALNVRDENTHDVNSWEEFLAKLTGKKTSFVKAHWCGNAKCEADIKEETTATIRCIPFDALEESGKCVKCGQDSNKRVIFAKAY